MGASNNGMQFPAARPSVQAGAVYGPYGMAADYGMRVAQQPGAAREKRRLNNQYEPVAESNALQARQASIASGTTGGAGFAQETQAYNAVLRALAQAQNAYRQQQYGARQGVLGMIPKVGGMMIGTYFGGPAGGAAGYQAGGAAADMNGQFGPMAGGQENY